MGLISYKCGLLLHKHKFSSAKIYKRMQVGDVACSYLRPHLSQSSPFLSAASFTKTHTTCFKLGNENNSKSRRLRWRLRAASDSSASPINIAPLLLESPPAQLLLQILQTHPHLFPAALDQQLLNLLNDRDAPLQQPLDLLLYRRIAQVREKERQKTLEDILYCFIVHKFVDYNISMIPKIHPSPDITGRIDFWPDQQLQLQSLHSPEAFQMIQSHLSLVLAERLVGPLQSLIDISKIKLGKLYAASVMYGYFLRRVDQRYQLERAMNTLPDDFGKNTLRYQQDPAPQNPLWDPDSLIQIPPDEEVVSYSEPMDVANADSYKLRSYVMYLDTETLQRYATIRSREAMSLIERQTQALFGRPDIKVSEGGVLETQNDEIVSITYSGMTMLILEAVAFGSLLWDAEDYVEPKYSFVVNTE